jgi:hypothetical protein
MPSQQDMCEAPAQCRDGGTLLVVKLPKPGVIFRCWHGAIAACYVRILVPT